MIRPSTTAGGGCLLQFYCNLYGNCKCSHLVHFSKVWLEEEDDTTTTLYRRDTSIDSNLSIAIYNKTSCQQRSTYCNQRQYLVVAAVYCNCFLLSQLVRVNGVEDSSTIRPHCCQYNFIPSSICNNQVISSSGSAASNHCNLQILYGKEQLSQLVNNQLISGIPSMQFIPTPRVVSSVLIVYSRLNLIGAGEGERKQPCV